MKNIFVIVIWLVTLSTLAYFFVEALEVEAQFQEKQVAKHISQLKNNDRYPPFKLKEKSSSGLGYWERKKNRE